MVKRLGVSLLICLAVGVGQATPVAGTALPTTSPLPSLTPKPPLVDKQIAMVIAPEKFRDEELLVPKQFFEARGATVTVFSSKTGEIKGMLGGTISVKNDLSSLKPADYDAIILVGGVGAQVYYDSEAVHQIASQAVSAGKVVGAICIAPMILAKAGLLKDKEATIWPSLQSELARLGAKVVDKPVVRSGNIITSPGPEAVQSFMEAIYLALQESPK